MEDNTDGLKNRSPFQTNQQVSTLSPIVDSWAGPQYEYGAFSGVVPDDNLGLINSTEVDDRTFRARDERKGNK